MRRAITVIIGIMIVLGAAGGLWFFLTDNAEITENAAENAEELTADEPTETVFRIDAERSQVEFNIDEVLRGEDFTVVGVTNQVAGDIRVNVANPATSEIGEIRINARDLTTDASNRNRALRQWILQSSQDEYEFITFEPTALNNMPEAVTVGEMFEFEIVGNLTIVETTQEVSFTAAVTPISETEIEGTAQTTVNYNDFNLTIPDVPFVASVADEVLLKIDFVAVAVPDAAEPATTD